MSVIKRDARVLSGCPYCPSQIRVQNLKIFESHKMSEDAVVRACKRADDHFPYVGFGDGVRARALLVEELGWCGCGDPDGIDEMMLDYLTSASPEHPDVLRADTPVRLLMAYVADQLEWTEHGTSIGGAWLTKEGITARAFLQIPARISAKRGETMT